MMSVGKIRFHSILLQYLVNCYVKTLKYQLQMEVLFYNVPYYLSAQYEELCDDIKTMVLFKAR